jgi:protein Cut8
MSTVINNNPLAAPHLFTDPRLQPSRAGTSAPQLPAHSQTTCINISARTGTHINIEPQTNTHPADAFQLPNMSGRKRKADDELDNERMSTSPSPSLQNRGLPSPGTHRTIKRTRTHTSAGRPLPLPRLLQTLSADELRNLVQNICNERSDIREAIVTKAPRPSVDSTLTVLAKYEQGLRDAFPLGNRHTSDYAYNRVRQNLLELIEALRDYTPYYLPPQETQTGLSLTYLDAVTNMIHRLPDWDTYQHQRHKNEAYDEIGRAWALVIREAAKTAGGFRLQLGNWDQKLVEHNQKSNGRMSEAVSELQNATGYMQTGAGAQATSPPHQQQSPSAMDQRAAIRQQLLSGTYGAPELGVGHGQW